MKDDRTNQTSDYSRANYYVSIAQLLIGIVTLAAFLASVWILYRDSSLFPKPKPDIRFYEERIVYVDGANRQNMFYEVALLNSGDVAERDVYFRIENIPDDWDVGKILKKSPVPIELLESSEGAILLKVPMLPATFRDRATFSYDGPWQNPKIPNITSVYADTGFPSLHFEAWRARRAVFVAGLKISDEKAVIKDKTRGPSFMGWFNPGIPD